MKATGMVLALCVIQSATAWSQGVRSLVNSGNDFYKELKYPDAEVHYRKALEKEQGLIPGHFNLGNSLYKQGKFDESMKEYEYTALKAESRDSRADAYFNLGNSFMKADKYQEAVKSYIEALKQKPGDQDAKYNLSYALEKLRQQQEQQQQQNKNDKNQDKNKDQQQDQNQGKDNKQDQNQDQQQQQQQQQDEQQQQQQQQMAQQEKRMSREDAERILEVLKNNERDVQKKLRVKKGVRARTEKDW